MTRLKLLKNFNWLFFDKLLRLLGGVLIGIWVARYLGPHDFGILNYAMAFISFFIFLPNLGLDQIIVRELTKYPDDEYHILGTAFLLKLAGALTSFIIILLLSIFLFPTGDITKIIVLILATTYIFQAADVIDYYYQSKILSKRVVIARDTAFIITSTFKVILIIYHYPIIYFALVFVLDIALSSFFLIWLYERKINAIRKWAFDKKLAEKLLKYSWPLMFSALLISIHTNIDQIMINSYLNKEEVGIYAAAVRLAGCWLFIPTIIVSTLLPYFVRLKSSNPIDYKAKLLQLYSLMFWMGTVVGFVITFLGADIIVLLYGEPYRDAYKALACNIWSGIFISQAVARGIWLVSENLQKYRLYNNLIAVIVNISGNMILIPLLGITGAAISTLITQALGTWGFSFLWKPLRKSTWDLIKSSNPAYMLRRGHV